jgi:hypothetical protein
MAERSFTRVVFLTGRLPQAGLPGMQARWMAGWRCSLVRAMGLMLLHAREQLPAGSLA